MKKWWKSRGVLGGVLAIIGATGEWLQQHGTDIPVIGEYGDVIAVVGGILATVGRIVATQPIKF